MREIKFRVWDDKDKKWLLGYDYPNLGGFSMFGECMLFDEWSSILNKFILQQKHRKPNDLKLMQFTGLKDKNDAGSCEVYEHDILTDATGLFFKVEWDYRDTGWCVIRMDKHKKYPLVTMLLQNAIVVGNIYENKGLLK